jgi:hypothetical protein
MSIQTHFQSWPGSVDLLWDVALFLVDNGTVAACLYNPNGSAWLPARELNPNVASAAGSAYITFQLEAFVTKTARTLFITHNVKTREHVDAWTTPFMQQPIWRIHVGTAKATDPKTHYVAESVSFFRFLQSNYDDIKKGLFGAHIVLLSDKGRDWHSRDGWSTLIKMATPRCRTPLGMQLEDQNERHVIAKGIKDAPTTDKDSEIPPIIRMLNVFNLTYTPGANDGWCCVESVISREAILLYTKNQYKFAKEMILRDPHWKWSWALERIIGVMFNTC